MEERLSALRYEIKNSPKNSIDEIKIQEIPFNTLIKTLYGDYLQKAKISPKRKSKANQTKQEYTKPNFDDLSPYVLTIMLDLQCKLNLDILYSEYPLIEKTSIKNGAHTIRYGGKERTLDNITETKNALPNQVSILYRYNGMEVLFRIFYNSIEIIKTKDISLSTLLWSMLKNTFLKIPNLFVTALPKNIIPEIQMGNYKFNLGFYVDRENTAKVFNSYSHIWCQYNPSLLPSVVIKYPIVNNMNEDTTNLMMVSTRTFFIFSSGNCVYVTRGTLKDTKETFDDFIKIITLNRVNIQLTLK